ncbi:hypothetical protein UPYG_G00343450 [Umbra pygmaea]|uniref:Uncharacterized protein n=1 Tax=Umbra pygmaea TaxID=75934 RepID=A0ABD0VYT1_UMBPY
MISQDFSVLHLESSGRLTENWNPVFSTKIICMAKKEKTADLLTNIDSLSGDKQGDIALQLLTVLLPTAPYKLGKRIFRPSSLEMRRAFIDVKPIATNMAEYLMKSTTEHPYVLMLGEGHQCSQAFVIVNGAALEQPSLLAAVDVCFKAFFVFDISYPKSCAKVWEFIQTTVFQIPGHESNAVKLMRAQIATT